MNRVLRDADVIIVGSGPAGVSAAWPLLEAGVNVLMLDAAGGDLPYPPQPDLTTLRTDPLRWRTELGATGPITGSDVSPKFATLLARRTLAGFGDSAGIVADDFMALGAHAAGGLSRIWGALATRYDDADLAAFPGGVAAMRTSYDRVARRIGTSGGEDIASADLSALAPPVAHLAGRHRRGIATPGFELITAPNAVLAEDRDGRRGCSACGLCLQGCSRGSIYHSALELPALRRFPNFAYRGNVFVQRLSTHAGEQLVEARIGREAVRFRAPTVVLAAGTLATTSLALRRIGLTGVRVRLESNPVGGIGFVVPRLIGRSLPDRAFGLGQLFYTLEAGSDVMAAGVFYGADTLPLAPVADRMPFTRPVALRAARALSPALVLATAYLPGRFSDNHLVVEEDGAAGRIRITGHQTGEAQRLLGTTFDRLARHVRQRGAWAIPGSRQMLMPGADAHPTGTLPMRGTGAAATDAEGQVVGAPGVFVADGAALPRLSARHPTLTIMANADRIGRLLASRIALTSGIADAG